MRVRIAVAVNDTMQKWNSAGWSESDDDTSEDCACEGLNSCHQRIVWIEAEIPPPAPAVVGEVKL